MRKLMESSKITERNLTLATKDRDNTLKRLQREELNSEILSEHYEMILEWLQKVHDRWMQEER